MLLKYTEFDGKFIVVCHTEKNLFKKMPLNRTKINVKNNSPLYVCRHKKKCFFMKILKDTIFWAIIENIILLGWRRLNTSWGCSLRKMYAVIFWNILCYTTRMFQIFLCESKFFFFNLKTDIKYRYSHFVTYSPFPFKMFL